MRMCQRALHLFAAALAFRTAQFAATGSALSKLKMPPEVKETNARVFTRHPNCVRELWSIPVRSATWETFIMSVTVQYMKLTLLLLLHTSELFQCCRTQQTQDEKTLYAGIICDYSHLYDRRRGGRRGGQRAAVCWCVT